MVWSHVFCHPDMGGDRMPASEQLRAVLKDIDIRALARQVVSY